MRDGEHIMATTGQYDAARDRLASGNASSQDRDLVAREAKQAGSRGNAAREAQAKDAKRSR